MNEGGKGHHTCTCTRRPHLDLALDDWTLNLNRRHTLTHTHIHQSTLVPWVLGYVSVYVQVRLSDHPNIHQTPASPPASPPASLPGLPGQPSPDTQGHDTNTIQQHDTTERQSGHLAAGLGWAQDAYSR